MIKNGVIRKNRLYYSRSKTDREVEVCRPENIDPIGLWVP